MTRFTPPRGGARCAAVQGGRRDGVLIRHHSNREGTPISKDGCSAVPVSTAFAITIHNPPRLSVTNTFRFLDVVGTLDPKVQSQGTIFLIPFRDQWDTETDSSKMK